MLTATICIFDSRTGVLVKVSKLFRDRKCIELRGTRTPNLRIHAECSINLSYKGQIIAVPWIWILSSRKCRKLYCIYINIYSARQSLLPKIKLDSKGWIKLPAVYGYRFVKRLRLIPWNIYSYPISTGVRIGTRTMYKLWGRPTLF